MTTKASSGNEFYLKPAERMVPSINWFQFLNNLAEFCLQRFKITLAKNGYKYKDFDYWRVIVFKCLNSLNTMDAADELDDIFYEYEQNGRGRKKKSKKALGGKYPRFERLTPNESQINDYIRKLPKWYKEHLTEFIFKAQLDYALELGLITREIEVYVDYTNKYYYGNDVYPTNPYITGVYNGPGTNKARKFCGFMITSGENRFFADVFLTQKDKKRAPQVADALENLLKCGFTIKRVEGDREFSNYDLIAKLNQLGIPYTGSMKKTMPIKKLVDNLLDGKCKQVVAHTLNQHQHVHFKLGPQNTFIIMKTDSGMRVKDVRKQLKAGIITHAEAWAKIHVFITTEKPPPSKHKWVRWGLRIVQIFRNRWRIETGYSDLNRIFPTSHARSNSTKKFMITLRMFIYNAWQFQKAFHHRLRKVPEVWKKGPTLRRFGYVMCKQYLCKKKFRSNMGKIRDYVGGDNK